MEFVDNWKPASLAIHGIGGKRERERERERVGTKRFVTRVITEMSVSPLGRWSLAVARAKRAVN